MAITFTELTASSSQGATTSYATASVTPASSTVVLLSVSTFQNTASQPSISSVSGCGLTWTAVGSVTHDTTGSDRGTTFLWKGVGTPTSGTITITFAASVYRCAWIVTEVAGANTTTPVVQTVTNTSDDSTSTSVTLAAFGDATNNATWLTYGGQISGTGATFTPEAGYTSGTEQAQSFCHVDCEYKVGGDTSPSFTVTGTGKRGIIAIEIAAGTSGLGATAGITTETDSSIALGRRKVKAAGVLTETDAAQPLARTKRLANPLVTETDAAQPIGRVKIKALGTAVETDTALPVGSGPHIIPVGTTVETDAAQALGRRKVRALSPAAETEAAQPISRAKVKAIGTALETDAAVVITKANITVAVGTAVETEAAVSLGRVKRKAVGVAVETSSAQPIVKKRGRTLGTAIETDSTRVFLKRKYKRVLGINVTETAMPLSVPQYRFEPPAYLVAFRQEHPWPEKRTWLGLNESFSIVRKAGVLTQVKTPNAEELVGQEGKDWFLGGRVYTVPHPVAKELIAAGYTPVPL